MVCKGGGQVVVLPGGIFLSCLLLRLGLPEYVGYYRKLLILFMFCVVEMVCVR